LDAVREAAAGIDAVAEMRSQALREAHQRAVAAYADARARRAEAIRAAEDAGVPRADIAAAAGLQWPMSRQRWSQLRKG
jgi:hypothetical protein